MKIRIDTYFDITCDYCGRSWSTDFNVNNQTMTNGGMGMSNNKMNLQRTAYKAGWKNRKGKTLCPECLKKRIKNDDLYC